jgi:hypothetical protein
MRIAALKRVPKLIYAARSFSLVGAIFFPAFSTNRPTSPHNLHSANEFFYCDTRVRERILHSAPKHFKIRIRASL